MKVTVKRIPGSRTWGVYKDAELFEGFFSRDNALDAAVRVKREAECGCGATREWVDHATWCSARPRNGV